MHSWKSAIFANFKQKRQKYPVSLKNQLFTWKGTDIFTLWGQTLQSHV